jgi:6-phosphogluconolactonase
VSVRIEVMPDAEAAARVVAERLAAAVAAGGHVVLTGGEPVRRVYEVTAELAPDWSGVEVWWGDERSVAPDDPWSNYLLAHESLLNRVAASPSAIHRIRGEHDPAQAAAAYEEELSGVTFDLVLNGVGPDGHTASLFPNAPTLDILDRLSVHAEPGHEPYVKRVTLTIPALENCREMIFLATGEEMADAVRRAFAEPPSPDTPASLVRSKHGETIAVLDRAAAAQLPGK